MNPFLGVFLIVAALAATYLFAAKGIAAGADIAAVLGAGIALTQGKQHAAVVAQLAKVSVPPPPPAPAPGAPS